MPSLYKTELYSKKLANLHFWISFVGILVYVVPMYIAGLMLGLMRESVTDGVLTYPNFMEMMDKFIPYYALRAVGGTLYLVGAIIGAYVIYKTVKKAGKVPDTLAEAASFSKVEHKKTVFGSVQKAAENLGLVMGMLTLVAVSIGGIVQILPLLINHSSEEKIATLKPYTQGFCMKEIFCYK